MQSKKDWKITLLPSPASDAQKPFNYVSGAESITSTSSTASASSSTLSEKKQQQLDLKQKKCWEFATSPFRNLFMNAFLLWMIGNQINIFPIIFTVMAIINPVKAILGVGQGT